MPPTCSRSGQSTTWPSPRVNTETVLPVPGVQRPAPPHSTAARLVAARAGSRARHFHGTRQHRRADRAPGRRHRQGHAGARRQRAARTRSSSSRVTTAETPTTPRRPTDRCTEASSSMWEGGVRVPAVASWPGHIRAGDDHVRGVRDDGHLCDGAGSRRRDLHRRCRRTSSYPCCSARRRPLDRDLFFVRREYPGGVNYGARNGDYKSSKTCRMVLHALQPPRRPGGDRDLATSQPAKLQQLRDAVARRRQVADAVPWQ